MDLAWTLVICIFVILILGIIIVLKKGFNEIIKGMESLNKRIKEIEDTVKKDHQ